MIDFDQVGFTYDGHIFVLDDVTLSVPSGAFVCILGGNGSGKSTLAKHINALLLPDRGTVRVFNRATNDDANLYFIRSNAGMVFQNPDDQIVASLVENDVAFGPENLGVPEEELRSRVTRALEQVGLQGFEKRETAQLSGGQKQRVAIAGVLAMEPQILVLDEASAMLDPRGRAGLMRVCQELHQAGMTIVMITHFMEEAALADTVYILEEGRIAATGTPQEVLADVGRLEELSLDVPFAASVSHRLQQRGLSVPPCITEDDLVEQIVAGATGAPALAVYEHASDAEVIFADTAVAAAEDTAAAPGADTAAAAAEEMEASAAHIVFDHVSYTYEPASGRKRMKSEAHRPDWGNDPDQDWALRDINFALREGEFLGVAGHTGSGKSTLLQHMNGLLHPTTGRVLVDGNDIAAKAQAAKAREHVGLVFQYPEHQLFAPSVFEDVAFGPRNLGLDENEVSTRVAEALALVGLNAEEIAHMSPFELSGGQQRRVAFAGVLAMKPHTLILDEPAAGLDPQARREFLRLIKSFHTDQYMTIVMASHNMDDLARLCDRILMLNQGTQFALGTPGDVFADAQACHTIGLDVPSAQRIASKLRDKHVPCKVDGVYTAEGLADALAAAFILRKDCV